MGIFSRSKHLWPTSKNADIVKCWHDYDKNVIPKDWLIIANHLRSKVKSRNVKNGIGIIDDQIILQGTVEETFSFGNNSYQVYLCLEKIDRKNMMKHAVIKQPDNIQMKEMVEVLRILSIAIEPEEPSLFSSVLWKNNVFFWHLIWPFDWDLADIWFDKTKYTPIHGEPILLLKNIDGQIMNLELKSEEKYTEKLFAQDLKIYREKFLKNHSLLIDPLIYLDQQKTTDLAYLQVALQKRYLPDNLGNVFPAFISAFIGDRLGACNGCGQIVCKHISIKKNDYVGDYINSQKSCRQFKNASIWPLSKKFYFGRFRYACQKCGFESFYDKWLKFIDQIPFYPEDVQAFNKPFSDFLESSE